MSVIRITVCFLYPLGHGGHVQESQHDLVRQSPKPQQQQQHQQLGVKRRQSPPKSTRGISNDLPREMTSDKNAKRESTNTSAISTATVTIATSTAGILSKSSSSNSVLFSTTDDDLFEDLDSLFSQRPEEIHLSQTESVSQKNWPLASSWMQVSGRAY